MISHLLHKGHGSAIFSGSLIRKKSPWCLLGKLRPDLVFSLSMTGFFTVCDLKGTRDA